MMMIFQLSPGHPKNVSVISCIIPSLCITTRNLRIFHYCKAIFISISPAVTRGINYRPLRGPSVPDRAVLDTDVAHCAFPSGCTKKQIQPA
jgi:hypothetical protein